MIFNRLKKIAYYKPVQVWINTFHLVEVPINVIILKYQSLHNFILNDRVSIFSMKFWFFFCYFLSFFLCRSRRLGDYMTSRPSLVHIVHIWNSMNLCDIQLIPYQRQYRHESKEYTNALYHRLSDINSD